MVLYAYLWFFVTERCPHLLNGRQRAPSSTYRMTHLSPKKIATRQKLGVVGGEKRRYPRLESSLGSRGGEDASSLEGTARNWISATAVSSIEQWQSLFRFLLRTYVSDGMNVNPDLLPTPIIPGSGTPASGHRSARSLASSGELGFPARVSVRRLMPGNCPDFCEWSDGHSGDGFCPFCPIFPRGPSPSTERHAGMPRPQSHSKTKQRTGAVSPYPTEMQPAGTWTSGSNHGWGSKGDVSIPPSLSFSLCTAGRKCPR